MNKHEIHKNRKEDWETPPEIFNPLNSYYGFTIDLAANAQNHKLPRWIGPGGKTNYGEDLKEVIPAALVVEQETCWINPPYGKFLAEFTGYIYEFARAGTKIVALLPASIDTGWFWDNIQPRSYVCGRRGRIQFLPRGKSGNPGANILAVFNVDAPPEYTGWRVL